MILHKQICCKIVGFYLCGQLQSTNLLAISIIETFILKLVYMMFTLVDPSDCTHISHGEIDVCSDTPAQ